MNATTSAPVRLTPELQAEYQQTFNDPAKRGLSAWHVAAKGLFAAGVIQTDPTIERAPTQATTMQGSNTEGQTL